MNSPIKVAFVCLHGAAKSVIGAELLKRRAAEAGVSVDAIALGLEPDPAVSPAAAQGLLAEGIDVRGFRPSLATPALLAGAARVIAFGCDVGAVAPPGVPVEQWTDVPAVSDGYPAARAVIAARVPGLVEACRSRAGS